MKAKSSTKAAAQPVTQPATAEEISRAIELIGEADFVRLNDYAQNRIIRIGPRAANGRTSDDLLQEAVTRLLNGRRHWYSDRVSLVQCLFGTLRSIASEWASYRERNSDSPEFADLESQQNNNQTETGTSPLRSFRSEVPNAEEMTIELDIEAERKALAHQIESSCEGDEAAGMVMLGWQSGMNGPAIQKEMGWTETEYRTTVRRIQRRAQKISGKHYGR